MNRKATLALLLGLVALPGALPLLAWGSRGAAPPEPLAMRSAERAAKENARSGPAPGGGLSITGTQAAFSPDLAPFFSDQSGCFALYDCTDDRLLVAHGEELLHVRRPPNSSFKIALSLIAFDQHLITPDTLFKWDGVDRGREALNADHTPRSWLEHSVVWVSQRLTARLGLERLEHYLALFRYGNEDFSGSVGRPTLSQPDPLTHAWLESSLKISAFEQLRFLSDAFGGHLPLSQDAVAHTECNLFLEILPGGWSLYGKTGSGRGEQESFDQEGSNQASFDQASFEEGWFVGFLRRDQRLWAFALNLAGKGTPLKNAQPAGLRAKAAALKILSKLIDPSERLASALQLDLPDPA